MENPLQLFSEDTNVYGVKANLPYGKNKNMYGVAGGIAGSVDKMSGIQGNIFWNEAKDLNGLQMGGIPGNRAVNVSGIQWGALSNIVEERVVGIQEAVFMNEAGDIVGLQIAGLHNKARRVAGIQVSPFVNDTESLAGMQIGLLNINRNGWLPFFPIVNFGIDNGGAELDGVEVGVAGGVFSPIHGDSGKSILGQVLFGKIEESAMRWGAEFEYRDFSAKMFQVSDIPVESYRTSVIGHYRFLRDSPVIPYLGASVSLAFNFIDENKLEAARPGISVKGFGGGFGGAAIAGADVPIGEHFSFFGEGRFGYDLHLTTVNASIGTENFGGFSGMGGIRYRF